MRLKYYSMHNKHSTRSTLISEAKHSHTASNGYLVARLVRRPLATLLCPNVSKVTLIKYLTAHSMARYVKANTRKNNGRKSSFLLF